MARKPLIAPGSFLPEGSAAESMDLQSRIIARDREKHGRGAAAGDAAGEHSPAASEPPPSRDEESYVASYEPSNIATKQPSDQHSSLATQQGDDLGATGAPATGADRAAEAAPAAERAGEGHGTLADSPPSDIASYVASYVASSIASDIAARIDAMRKSRLEQLNIRIPEGFNEWLEEEAHRRRKEGVTKQSIVTDALAALIRERLTAEAGEGV